MNLRSFSTLQIALGASFAVHAALLTVRFIDPEGFNRVFQDTPLEVILVNARSNEKPEKAQAIAQASMAGGGEAAKGRATSPLPPSALAELGDAAEEAQRKIDSMQDQQMVMLAQVRRMLAAMPPPDPKQDKNTPEAVAREDKRRQLVKLLAEIERLDLEDEPVVAEEETEDEPPAGPITIAVDVTEAEGDNQAP